MAQAYRPDLLAPYLALPQGEKVQAECMSQPLPVLLDTLTDEIEILQTSGLTAMVVSAPRRPSVLL